MARCFCSDDAKSFADFLKNTIFGGRTRLARACRREGEEGWVLGEMVFVTRPGRGPRLVVLANNKRKTSYHRARI
jgi:hypothetical protein